jgi:SAM-dependent methyltransferase
MGGTMTAARVEPGSFRDPHNRVFTTHDGVLRTLSSQGLADWEALAATDLFPRLVAEGKLVQTERVNGEVELPEELRAGAAAILRHEKVPYVSYPYEWPFGMLRDAALLQLEVLDAALAEDLVLKDSSPYNVQWRGTRPVFIDVGSFERLPPGEPWIGYRQFCMLFLYPLLLQAYKDVPFQPWLRGSIDGITPQQLRSLMSLRDLFRRGVLTHVYLHSRLERGRSRTARDVQRELRAAGFKKELIVANVRGLAKLIRGLQWKLEPSAWSDYAATTSYSDEDAARKEEFVRAATGSRRWDLVWDIGCNTGRFARIAAENAQYVVALDADAAVVERLFRALEQEGSSSILPLTVNVVDPSPALGWRGSERGTLAERGRPDLTLCLALVHHVVIGGNVPVRDFVRWLATLESAVVLEFPTPEDPMVKRLLASKREGLHADYERDWFERCLHESFEVARTESIASGTRVLYFARPRA